jgi:DNA-binding transcriptional MerR regulator
MQTTTFTISELAREFDITTRAIRFYEDQGLLNPDRDGRRRVYSRRDRTRLKLILRGKRLGFTLGEVRELFEHYDSVDGEERQLRRYIDILSRKRVKLEQQQQDLEAALDEIATNEAQCRRLLREKGLSVDGRSSRAH